MRHLIHRCVAQLPEDGGHDQHDLRQEEQHGLDKSQRPRESPTSYSLCEEMKKSFFVSKDRGEKAFSEIRPRPPKNEIVPVTGTTTTGANR